jgi:hypothetical protein
MTAGGILNTRLQGAIEQTCLSKVVCSNIKEDSMFNALDYLNRTKTAIETMIELANKVGGVPIELANVINGLTGVHDQLSMMTGHGTLITESVFIWFANAVIQANDLVLEFLRFLEENFNNQALVAQSMLEARGQARCN